MASVYDRRMAEIARQRQAERAGLDRIEESTQTISAGTSDPVNWILGIASIVLIPFTGGLSVGLGVLALLRATKGGQACAQAIVPTPADLTAPKAGCTRIFAALGVLILMIVVILLFAAVVAYHAGVKP